MAELTDLYVEVVAATDKALLVATKDVNDHPIQFWLPRSQIVEGGEDLESAGDEGDIAIPEWLAEKQGLV